MKCKVCNSEINFRKKYDQHIAVLIVKNYIKSLLPYFDFIIPGFFTKLKQYSSKRPLPFFGGYVKICSDCGHGLMEKPPTEDELKKYYTELYWSRRPSLVYAKNTADYRQSPRAIHQVDFVWEKIKHAKISDILEIGAGAAFASLLIRDKCRNFAINLHACEIGQQWEDYYQRQKIKKIADYFPFETTKKFDYIHTSHFLEHALNLDETLSKINQILNHSGYIFVEVPNTEHFYWDLPITDSPHIQFFTRRSLTRAFDNNNFELLNIDECGVTYLDRQNGVALAPDRYGACKNGLWIRALFKKK